MMHVKGLVLVQLSEGSVVTGRGLPYYYFFP